MMRQRNVNLSAECCWLRRRVRSSLIIRYFYCVHVVQTASVSRKRLRDDITYVAEGSDIDRSIIGAGPCTTSNAHLWLVLALLNSISCQLRLRLWKLYDKKRLCQHYATSYCSWQKPSKFSYVIQQNPMLEISTCFWFLFLSRPLYPVFSPACSFLLLLLFVIRALSRPRTVGRRNWLLATVWRGPDVLRSINKSLFFTFWLCNVLFFYLLLSITRHA